MHAHVAVAAAVAVVCNGNEHINKMFTSISLDPKKYARAFV